MLGSKLIILIFIGFLINWLFLPFGNYCVGMVDGLIFAVLILIYGVIFIYDIFFSLKKSKIDKKAFNRSSLYVTIGFIALFTVIQNLNIFESKTILYAKTQEKYEYILSLKKIKTLNFKKNGWTRIASLVESIRLIMIL